MSHDVRLRRSARGPLVLVVDEELTRRSILSRMIRAFGYSVRNCPTSREALQFLRDQPREVRLLIADLMLPGCALFAAICAVWPSPMLRVADRGLREGMLRQFTRQLS